MPSFFEGNPWLDILAQRGTEPEPDFVASSMLSSLTAREAMPIIETEPVASSPATPIMNSPRELIVRLEVPPELVEVICPKCGRLGKLYEMRRGGRTYILVLHGRQKCYLGPVDEVKVNWPSLAERGLLNNAQHEQARVPLPSGSQAEECGLSVAQNLNLPQIALPQVRGFPSQVKGAGLRSPWRRPAWVQIPPPAPIPIGKHI